MILKMAFRNLFRHKKRTILTLIAMTIGIMLAILGEGLNVGMYEQVKDVYIKSDIGYYKIYGKNYYEERDTNERLEYIIKDKNGVEEILKNRKKSSRIVFDGKITDSYDELNAIFIGADKKEEETVFDRSSYLVEGEFLTSDDEIVIGYELANLLNLELGMEITILARAYDKSMNAYDRKIGGIIKTGNPLMDARVVFLTKDFAKEFVDADIINDIVIGEILDEKTLFDLEQEEIDLVSFDEELEEINTITTIRRRVFGVISTVILIMAGLSIANTMLMAMMERKREIGILMANGMERKKILRLFLYEGGISGVIGGFIGFTIGSVWVLYYEKYGLNFFNAGNVGINLPLSEKLYFGYNFVTAISFFAIGVLFALIASYYPAYKATTMEPVEVIRGDN